MRRDEDYKERWQGLALAVEAHKEWNRAAGAGVGRAHQTERTGHGSAHPLAGRRQLIECQRIRRALALRTFGSETGEGLRAVVAAELGRTRWAVIATAGLLVAGGVAIQLACALQPRISLQQVPTRMQLFTMPSLKNLMAESPRAEPHGPSPTL